VGKRDNSGKTAYDVAENHVVRQYLLPLQLTFEREQESPPNVESTGPPSYNQPKVQSYSQSHQPQEQIQSLTQPRQPPVQLGQLKPSESNYPIFKPLDNTRKSPPSPPVENSYPVHKPLDNCKKPDPSIDTTNLPSSQPISTSNESISKTRSSFPISPPLESNSPKVLSQPSISVAKPPAPIIRPATVSPPIPQVNVNQPPNGPCIPVNNTISIQPINNKNAGSNSPKHQVQNDPSSSIHVPSSNTPIQQQQQPPSNFTCQHEYARVRPSTVTISSTGARLITPDGFHSSSSDPVLAAKYGHTKNSSNIGPPPMGSTLPSSSTGAEPPPTYSMYSSNGSMNQGGYINQPRYPSYDPNPNANQQQQQPYQYNQQQQQQFPNFNNSSHSSIPYSQSSQPPNPHQKQQINFFNPATDCDITPINSNSSSVL
jgi:hypothetical protein